MVLSRDLPIITSTATQSHPQHHRPPLHTLLEYVLEFVHVYVYVVGYSAVVHGCIFGLSLIRTIGTRLCNGLRTIMFCHNFLNVRTYTCTGHVLEYYHVMSQFSD